jgi:hypothetical protein
MSLPQEMPSWLYEINQQEDTETVIDLLTFKIRASYI